jgi:hypothetical protein
MGDTPTVRLSKVTVATLSVTGVAALAFAGMPASAATGGQTVASQASASQSAATALPPRAPMPITYPVSSAAGIKSPSQIRLTFPSSVTCTYRTSTRNAAGVIISFGAYCTPKPTTAGSATVAISYTRGFFGWRATSVLKWLSSTYLGSAGAWAPASGTKTLPGRWNPCKPAIIVKVNYGTALAPNPTRTAQEEALVKLAIANIKSRSGLPLVYGGRTTFMPTKSNRYDPTNPSGISMAFATAGVGFGRSDLLPGSVYNRGVGGFSSVSEVPPRIIDGFVVIDNRTLTDPLLTGGATGLRVAVYMHELGHSVGLAHADPDQYQAMYSIVRVPAARWGLGDLSGLRAIGRKTTDCQVVAPGLTTAQATPNVTRRTPATTTIVD